VETDDTSSITTIHPFLSEGGLQPFGDMFGTPAALRLVR
jgi:hypothetical protein